ncbi:GNAT family N-acetyltransferase [Paenibacillus sp. FSL H8-0537]|uniref:GNAT family N-acetyltransferase n=1 Tax=Paenibacillus sp. FSL H8-0537 TaxID=2921399 RepID=UPI0031016A45
MIIKIALVSDAEAITALKQAASRGQVGRFGTYRMEPSITSLAAIREQFQDHIFLKAVVDGESIVGSIHLHVRGEVPYIGGLIVHPEYLDRGVGEELLLEAEALFKIGQQLEAPQPLDEEQDYRKTTFVYKRLIRFN